MTTGIISLFILILQSVVVMSPKVVNTYQIEFEGWGEMLIGYYFCGNIFLPLWDGEGNLNPFWDLG